jgi:DNA-binding CsgD family transcriptional regulator
MDPLEESAREEYTSDSSSPSSGRLPQAVPPTTRARRGIVGRQGEVAALAQLLETARNGGSATLVVHGEPGIGKSTLLNELIGLASGFRIARSEGVQGEVDLPYAGLQQLCRGMLDTLDVLPPPQREALSVAFGGLSSGRAPDRYLVGLAALGLLSETAVTQPLLCVVDDAQWLDAETTQALAFIARRLAADTVVLAVASRERLDDLEGLPELQLDGLAPPDSRALLDSVVTGHLDGPVRERFLAETRGNPLALLELSHALTSAEAATGVLSSPGDSLSRRMEEAFQRRLESLPDDTRRLLVLAAAEPLGDPLLLVRAAAELGLRLDSADAAEEAGLFEIREHCSFRHPLVRSAAYRSAARQQRRQAHAALAAATDARLDPDRRAWHRAQATAVPDEAIAAELEGGAARAKSRGGLAAAGAFLERATQLTPDATTRSERALAAAAVLLEAGSFEAAGVLLHTLDDARLGELSTAQAERLRAELFLAQCTADQETEALVRLLAAAEQLTRLDPAAGNAAHLEALRRALLLATPSALDRVLGALSASPPSESAAIVALLLRGASQMLTEGYPAGTELLRTAMISLRDSPRLDESGLPLFDWGYSIAKSLWDFDSWEVLADRFVRVARDCGALMMLPRALACQAEADAVGGDLPAAAAARAEAAAVADATRATRWSSVSSMYFEAMFLDETEALARFARGELEGSVTTHFDHGRAIVHNAAGRYESALEAAQRSCDRHPLKVSPWALVELVEAAVRCGEHAQARAGLTLLTERTQLSGTHWALGLDARSTALVTDDSAGAELLYRRAIEHLTRARTRPDLGRAYLLYGEWLRRQNRRADAREQLRSAHQMFTQMGIPGFAERARRELAATGETVRKRTLDTRVELTPQEAQIARLAAERLTNPEIAAQLFLSHRTVEYHLRKVFVKLGISSRKELGAVMSVRASA